MTIRIDIILRYPLTHKFEKSYTFFTKSPEQAIEYINASRGGEGWNKRLFVSNLETIRSHKLSLEKYDTIELERVKLPNSDAYIKSTAMLVLVDTELKTIRGVERP